MARLQSGTVGEIGEVARSERWQAVSVGAIGLERWRSSFFASHTHLRTHSFFKNWMHGVRVARSSAVGDVREAGTGLYVKS